MNERAPALQPADPNPGKIAAWLGWTLVFTYSFAPFDFTSSPDYTSAWSSGRDSTPARQHVADLALHALAFAAVGAVDRHAGNQTASAHRVLHPALLRGVLRCVVIEVAQLFLRGRHARLADLGINAVALSLGHAMVRVTLVRRINTRVGSILRLHAKNLRRSLVLVWCVSWSLLVVLPRWFVTLRDWDRTFPLLIGNERSGDRPWQGEIRYAAIYDRALSAGEVQRIREEEPGRERGTAARLQLGLLAGYDFTRDGRSLIVPDGRLVDQGLSLRPPPGSTWQSGAAPALVLNGDAVLTSAGPVEPVITSIAGSGAFTVEVWCRAGNLTQSGPARIVGISSSIWSRNFTLGQEGKDLHFRVRNALNGPNGETFELRAPDVFSEDLVHLVATYARRVSSVFLDGRRVGPTVDLRQPSVLLGLSASAAASIASALLAGLSLLLIAWSPARRPAGRKR